MPKIVENGVEREMTPQEIQEREARAVSDAPIANRVAADNMTGEYLDRNELSLRQRIGLIEEYLALSPSDTVRRGEIREVWLGIMSVADEAQAAVEERREPSFQKPPIPSRRVRGSRPA